MFKEIETEEEFIIEQQKQMDDDNSFVEYLQDFLNENQHRHINFALLNVGNLLKICSIYLELKEENIHDFLKLAKSGTKKRKMNVIIKELNEKINLRYEFDEDETIIECLYVYEEAGYIRINKTKFISLLLEKNFIDPAYTEEDNLNKI